jgi:pimeloyl-ACP methyl ester carboxylesterase
MARPSARSAANAVRSSAAPWRATLASNKGWLIAGALAASAIFNRVRTSRAEAATPPEGNFIEVDGVRLHVVIRGSGTPVVLLHGNGVTLQDFGASGVAATAADRHQVIQFDRPGSGYSSRPRSRVWTPRAQAALLAAALEKLGTGKAVVVGHSWGALVALAMAIDHPERVTGLVLLSGYYYGTARPDVLPFALPALPIVGDVMAHTVSPLSGMLMSPAVIKAAFAPAPVSEKIRYLPLGLSLRPSQVRATAADASLMVPSAIELSRHYREITLPVIVMAGEGDLITRADTHAERLARDIPGAELRTVPDQGHLFHYAVPEQVAAAINDVAGMAKA